MKILKWLSIGTVCAVLLVAGAKGTWGDDSANGQSLTIVQSEWQRDSDGVLCKVTDGGELLPVTQAELSKERVCLQGDFPLTDGGDHTVSATLSAEVDLYCVENALDHIVVVTNTGTLSGYVRTWFAFEMGDLSASEWEAAVLLNRNTTAWVWDDFTYGITIGGERYAVVSATYGGALAAGETTAPSLLQLLLCRDASSELALRLDGNRDGNYEIKVFSRAVSDEAAWEAVGHPFLQG